MVAQPERIRKLTHLKLKGRVRRLGITLGLGSLLKNALSSAGGRSGRFWGPSTEQCASFLSSPLPPFSLLLLVLYFFLSCARAHFEFLALDYRGIDLEKPRGLSTE